MNPTISDGARASTRAEPRLSRAGAAGAIIIGCQLVGALLFRTHEFEVTPRGWELVRHFNLFFMWCELVVIALAFGGGLNVSRVWSGLARIDKSLVIGWLATFWIGSAFSQQPAYSLVTAISWPIHLLFGIAVWHLARSSTRPAADTNGLILGGLLAVVLGLLAMTLVHFTHVPDPAFLPNGEVFWGGAVPGFMGVRLFGVALAYAALFGAGILLSGKSEPEVRLAACALSAVAFAALCWSGTRAAVPAFFGALVLLPMLARHRPGAGAWMLVGGIAVASFAASILIPAPGQGFGTLALFRGELTGGGDPTAGRWDIWRSTVSGFLDRPLFGQGEGSIRWLVAQTNGMHVQPHNVLLQLYLHWGAVGASLAICLGVRLGAAMVVCLRRDPALLPYGMIVAASLIAGQFDGALYHPQMVMMPVAALAFVLGKGSAEANITRA